MQTEHAQKPLISWMGIVPPAAAAITVLVEPLLMRWAGRMELLPLATLLVLSVLVHPRLRYLLMITLCYGVSFLALRDIARLSQVALPPPLNYELYEVLKTLSLLIVAGLSATAAVAETLRPGEVWARRCYFGAAALYFLGMGVLNFVWHSTWQSVMLCVTGLTAGLGCVFADRIVATEANETEDADLPSDEVLQQARETAHRAALQAKEWRDTLVAVRDDRDTPSPGSA